MLRVWKGLAGGRVVCAEHAPCGVYLRLTLMRFGGGMSDYCRPRVTGASIFFTMALQDRASALLCDQVQRLREAVALTRHERPFGIEAWVVLPDHLHCIWTLPAWDSDFATRWRLIKAMFSRGLAPGRLRDSHLDRKERGIWQRVTNPSSTH